ncbi:hypothetical protein DC430_24265, partial [Rhizobium rhizogenes]
IMRPGQQPVADFGTHGRCAFDADHKLLVERATAVGAKISHRLLPGTHNGVVPHAVDESIRFFNNFV